MDNLETHTIYTKNEDNQTKHIKLKRWHTGPPKLCLLCTWNFKLRYKKASNSKTILTQEPFEDIPKELSES